MMDNLAFKNDLIESIARLVLHKDEQAKGVACPNTDNWHEIYNGKRDLEEAMTHSPTIDYSRFKAEVDGTVAQILNNLYMRMGSTASEEKAFKDAPVHELNSNSALFGGYGS